jgi:S1-C subfamily serine protease
MNPLMKIFSLIALSLWFSAPASASACDKPFTKVFEEVEPSVVRIFSVTIDPFTMIERVQLEIGTGVVIDDEGHIVTNAHIVYRASEIMISSGNENMLPATLIGMDPISDLAVIKPDVPGIKLPKARLGHSDTLAIGEEVLAVGYPFGIGKSATRGIISAVERVVPLSPFSWMTPYLQTDAAISPGNSGGPLFNRCAEVIGINTLFLEQGQNINFTIPVDLVRQLAPMLIKEGKVIRAWHGINGRMVPPPLMFALHIAPGFLVETVEPGSPAEKIGLRGGTFPVILGTEEYLLGGDVINKVNGRELTDLKTAADIVRSLKVGDKITLQYWRDGTMHEAEVVLPERPVLPGDTRKFDKLRSHR